MIMRLQCQTASDSLPMEKFFCMKFAIILIEFGYKSLMIEQGYKSSSSTMFLYRELTYSLLRILVSILLW